LRRFLYRGNSGDLPEGRPPVKELGRRQTISAAVHRVFRPASALDGPPQAGLPDAEALLPDVARQGEVPQLDEVPEAARGAA
jgi:hypothetical protein